jgi:hypothetical protein
MSDNPTTAAVEAMARALCLADNANPDSVQPVTATVGYARGGSDHRMAYRTEEYTPPQQWTFYQWKAEQVLKHLPDNARHWAVSSTGTALVDVTELVNRLGEVIAERDALVERLRGRDGA